MKTSFRRLAFSLSSKRRFFVWSRTEVVPVKHSNSSGSWIHRDLEQFSTILKDCTFGQHECPLRFALRQDPSLDLGFWSVLTFLHYGIEEAERHLLWRPHKKFREKVGQIYHRSCLSVLGFIQKCAQNRPSPKVQSRSRDWIEHFLPLEVSPRNLAHLFIMVTATKSCLRFFLIFAWGLSYGLSKSKNGVKLSLNFERS